MNEPQMPVARKEGLVIQEMPAEILVYDLETNKAHCLNETAAAVWKFCDGKNSVADISGLLTKTRGTPVQEDMIWLAVDQLSERNLLENYSAAANFSRQNRREVIKKIGLAAVIALPIVTSLAAPTAASAGSTCATTACTCTLAAVCTAVSCACQSGVGGASGNCPANCTGGCACTVAANAISCSSNCT